MRFNIYSGPIPIRPDIRKGRFYNSPEDKPTPFLVHSIAMLLHSLSKKLRLANNQPSSTISLNSPQITTLSPEPQSIMWLGHASFLLKFSEANVLTDPIFGNASWLFPRTAPSICHKSMPRIDYILISHNHRDHMDAQSLVQVRQHQPQILVPKGAGAWFLRRGFKHVHELSWWEQLSLGSGPTALDFTFLPAFHWSQRGLFDKNRSLWGSWLIREHQTSIYFGGDTAYPQHFKVIGEQFPAINCALLPIGPCEPRKWLSHAHMSAEEAGQAFLDLSAKVCVPMHWGTFKFGIDGHVRLPPDHLMT